MKWQIERVVIVRVQMDKLSQLPILLKAIVWDNYVTDSIDNKES